MYPGFLQHAGFMAMNPDRHLKSHYDFYLHLLRGDDSDTATHRRFYDEYNAVLNMPAEFYLDTSAPCSRSSACPKAAGKSTASSCGRKPSGKTVLLTVEGELDDISGQGRQTRGHQAVQRHPSLAQDAYTVRGAGHYGIFSGRRWCELVCPKIAEFIRQS